MIYFVQADHGGPIKIGYSANEMSCKSRLNSLQTGNPAKLVIRKIIDGDHFTEMDFHNRFVNYRICGEWFSPIKELCDIANCEPGLTEPDYIEELRKAAFCVGYTTGYSASDEDAEIYEAERIAREAERTKHLLGLPTRMNSALEAYVDISTNTV